MTEENKTATASEDSEVVNFEVDQESFKVKPPDGNRAFISVWDDVLSESECSNIIEKYTNSNLRMSFHDKKCPSDMFNVYTVFKKTKSNPTYSFCQ